MLDGAIHLRFDTVTHPIAIDRTAAWQDAMSLSVDVSFLPDEVEVFSGGLAFHPFGTVLLVESNATPHTVIRNKSTIIRSGTAHVILDYFVSGGFDGTVGGRRLAVGAGDCFIMDLKGTMRVHLNAAHYIGVVIPRPLFQAQVGVGQPIHGLRLPAGSPEADLLGGVLMDFVAQAPRLSELRAAALGLSLTSMISACIGVSKRSPVVPSPATLEPDLVRVRRYIERYASDPDLGPDRLCAAFNLSRAALYRLFKDSPGVANAIRKRRAEIARRTLGDPKASGRSIEAIARASGFSDLRSFARALRDIYGATPSQLRRTPDESATTEHRVGIGSLFDTSR